MATYLLSVFADREPGPFGPYDSKESMLEAFAATGEFNEMLQREGHFVYADGLQAPMTAVTVDATSGETVRTDGPHIDSPVQLGGFWVVEAKDLAEAVHLAELGSRACRGAVEVRPFATAESMGEMLGE